jgi:hypothetical protein
VNELLIGGISTASFVAGIFFLRFWRVSRDRFFLLFATAFWLEGAHRIAIYHWAGADEASPLYYLIRLVAYGLIIIAIVDKNRRRT